VSIVPAVAGGWTHKNTYWRPIYSFS
jgi:hypothetical protein